MRWRTKPRPPAPKDGDTRITFRFAWLPVETAEGVTVWLADVYFRQRYSDTAWMSEWGYVAAWSDLSSHVDLDAARAARP